MEEETKIVKNNDYKPIAGAILIAGLAIAGAILVKDNSASSSATLPRVEQIAKETGLNLRSFRECLAGGKHGTKVANDILDGRQAGVRGTPTSFILIDGQVVAEINGAQPIGVVREMLDAIGESNYAALPAGTNISGASIRPVAEDERILGNRNANIIIVEYSDTECPFCKSFHATMHQLINERGDDLAWAYRHFPIAQIHPNAEKEAEASECAAELGGNEAFWKYLDRIFAR